MTSAEFLLDATRTLTEAGVASARLDCLVLLEDELGLERASILAHPETVLNAAQSALLNKKIIQRSKHVPLAYLRGRAPFYGRSFAVSPAVLVPRPETETMIEMLKKLPLAHSPHILDVGTGSGCIGISAALEIPGAIVTLSDISAAALAVAKQNAAAYDVKVRFHKADLLTENGNTMPTKPGTSQYSYHVILANLPYVPEALAINKAARHEPPIALFSGSDGLDLYRQFWGQVSQKTPKPSYVLTESLVVQHHQVKKLAVTAGYRLRNTEGLIQVFALA